MLRVRTKINLQIFSVEAPAWQDAKEQEYQAYSELSQRSQAGCIGAKNVKLFLREPLKPIYNELYPACKNKIPEDLQRDESHSKKGYQIKKRGGNSMVNG